MTARSGDRVTARSRAEQLLSRQQQKDVDRLTERDRQNRAQDEKTARLRALRLAKEAAEAPALKRRRPS